MMKPRHEASHPQLVRVALAIGVFALITGIAILFVMN